MDTLEMKTRLLGTRGEELMVKWGQAILSPDIFVGSLRNQSKRTFNRLNSESSVVVLTWTWARQTTKHSPHGWTLVKVDESVSEVEMSKSVGTYAFLQKNQDEDFQVGNRVSFLFMGDGHSEFGTIASLYVDEDSDLKGAGVQLDSGRSVRALYCQLTLSEEEPVEPEAPRVMKKIFFGDRVDAGTPIIIKSKSWEGYRPIFESYEVDAKTGAWAVVSLTNRKGVKTLYRVRPDNLWVETGE